MDRRSLAVAGVLVGVCALPFIAVPVYRNFFSPEHDICTIITEHQENAGVLVDRCKATRMTATSYRVVLRVQVAGVLPMLQVCGANRSPSQWEWVCQ